MNPAMEGIAGLLHRHMDVEDTKLVHEAYVTVPAAHQYSGFKTPF